MLPLCHRGPLHNDDNLCLAQALAIDIAKNNVEKASDGEKRNAKKIYRNIQKADQKRQTSGQKRRALEYQALAGVPTDRKSSLLDIPFLKMFY